MHISLDKHIGYMLAISGVATAEHTPQHKFRQVMEIGKSQLKRRKPGRGPRPGLESDAAAVSLV